MIPFICKYCGKDTSEIEYDYLHGHDHLACVLEYEKTDTHILPASITISAEFILDTPNDQELGAKVRQLYYENNG
jgi:hypothetical protein